MICLPHNLNSAFPSTLPSTFDVSEVALGKGKLLVTGDKMHFVELQSENNKKKKEKETERCFAIYHSTLQRY